MYNFDHRLSWWKTTRESWFHYQFLGDAPIFQTNLFTRIQQRDPHDFVVMCNCCASFGNLMLSHTLIWVLKIRDTNITNINGWVYKGASGFRVIFTSFLPKSSISFYDFWWVPLNEVSVVSTSHPAVAFHLLPRGHDLWINFPMSLGDP